MRPKYTRLTCTGDYGYRFHFNAIASLWLDFTEGELDPRITFSRASGGTRFNSQGQLVVEPAGTPRFNHNPVTLAPLGLLIEGQRTNLALNSFFSLGNENETPTSWVQRGTTTGVKLADASAFGGFVMRVTGTTHIGLTTNNDVRNSVSGLTAGTSYRVSVRYRTISGSALVNFIGVQHTLPSSTDWSVFSFSATALSTGHSLFFGGATQFDLDYVQLEAGASASSYIPTTTAAATRAADVAVMTGTNFSDWYNQSEGTFYVESDCSFADASGRASLAVTNDPTAQNFMIVSQFVGSAHRYFAYSADGMFFPPLQSTGTVYPTGFSKVAAAYKTGDFAASRDGDIKTTSVVSVPTVVRMSIGGIALSDTGGMGQHLFGHIKRIGFAQQKLDPSILVLATKP